MQRSETEAENVVVDGGDLANVFVYVKDGLGSRTFDVPRLPLSSTRAAASIIPTCWV